MTQHEGMSPEYAAYLAEMALADETSAREREQYLGIEDESEAELFLQQSKDRWNKAHQAALVRLRSAQ